MTRARMWNALTAGVVVLILLIGWFVVLGGPRSEAETLNAQAANQELSNRAEQVNIARLQKQAEDLSTAGAELARIDAKIPATPETADLLRTLSAAATDANVDLTNITPVAPIPYIPPVLAEPTAPAPAPSGSASGAADTAEATAVPDLYVVPLTLTAKGNFSDLQLFLANLESTTRAILVNGVTVNQDLAEDAAVPGGLAISISASVYYSPLSGTVTLPPSPAPAPTTAVVS